MQPPWGQRRVLPRHVLITPVWIQRKLWSVPMNLASNWATQRCQRGISDSHFFVPANRIDNSDRFTQIFSDHRLFLVRTNSCDENGMGSLSSFLCLKGVEPIGHISIVHIWQLRSYFGSSWFSFASSQNPLALEDQASCTAHCWSPSVTSVSLEAFNTVIVENKSPESEQTRGRDQKNGNFYPGLLTT